MLNEILCDIEFYNSETHQVEQFIGKVKVPQLTSEKEKSITAKKMIRHKRIRKIIKNRIYKNDIKKIIFY
jgi:hypothetical protein